MIHIFAGSPKNGSHLQLYIFLEALRLQGIEPTNFGRYEFDQKRLEKCRNLLKEYDGKKGIYWSKGHFGISGKGKDIDILREHKNMRIYIIWRNMLDVLVSSYFFQMNYWGEKFKNFEEYYNKYGYNKIHKQCMAIRNWQIDDPRIHCSRYETLVAGAYSELLEHAGIQEVDLGQLRDRLSIESCRSRHSDPEGKYFRKGIVGDHKNIMSEAQIGRALTDMDTLGKEFEVDLR